MKNRLDLLERLCDVFAVDARAENMSDFLMNICKKNKWPYKRHKHGCLTIGNEDAKLAFSCHIDEVGFVVTGINTDGSLSIKPYGWISPGMAVGHMLEFPVGGGLAHGLCVLKNNLQQIKNTDSFNDIKVVLDATSKEKTVRLGFTRGTSGRYKSEFCAGENGIFATSLDNKLSAMFMLEMIHADPNILKRVVFCFTTYEEENNVGGNALVRLLRPGKIFILDVTPRQIIRSKAGSDLLHIPFADGKFLLSPEFKYLIRGMNYTKVTFDIPEMGPSETEYYKRNKGVDAVHLLIPVENYHAGSYFVNYNTINNASDFLRNLTAKLL